MLLIYLFKTEANPIQLFIYLLKHNYLFFFYQAQQLLRRYNFVICYKLSRKSKNEFKKGLIGLAPGGPNHFLNPKFQIPGSPLNIWKNHWGMADKKTFRWTIGKSMWQIQNKATFTSHKDHPEVPSLFLWLSYPMFYYDIIREYVLKCCFNCKVTL